MQYSINLVSSLFKDIRQSHVKDTGPVAMTGKNCVGPVKTVEISQ